MRVYQFRQFRICDESLLSGMFASLSSVLGDQSFMLLILLLVLRCGAIVQHNLVKQYFEQTERLTRENYC